jgi:predicted aldo/keto reductase-like oxidoreductase
LNKRDFGKTGLKTSMLGFGGFHLLEIPVSEGATLLNRYLDAGGNYIETAAGYGDGESEIKIGLSVAHRRSEYILATKCGDRERAACEASIDRSLANLKTDHVDLLLMHAVGSMKELETILAPGGALEAAEKARKAGKVNFIGISMHGVPDVLVRALKEYPFDAVMTTINYYDRFNFPGIEDVLVPLAHSKGVAIILMKAVGDGLLWKSAAPAFRYAFDRDVAVVVAGANNREMLENDIRYAEQFQPMTPIEVDDLFMNAPELGNYVCRLCGKCLPCPEGINIPLVFEYEGIYDRQMADGVVINPAEFALKERLRFWFQNTEIAKNRYESLERKANACTKCGDCMPRCPYKIDIIRKLAIVDYKLGGNKIF